MNPFNPEKSGTTRMKLINETYNSDAEVSELLSNQRHDLKRLKRCIQMINYQPFKYLQISGVIISNVFDNAAEGKEIVNSSSCAKQIYDIRSGLNDSH